MLRSNRLRNITVSFRISEEENQLLTRKIKLTGMKKREYIINRLLERDIQVVGNHYVIKSLKDEIVYFIDKIQHQEHLSKEDKQILGMVVEELKGFYQLKQ